MTPKPGKVHVNLNFLRRKQAVIQYATALGVEWDEGYAHKEQRRVVVGKALMIMMQV